MPLFGCASANFGAGSRQANENVAIAGKFTTTTGGEVINMIAEIYDDQGGTNREYQCGIYDSSGDIITNGKTDVRDIDIGTYSVEEFTFSTNPTIAATTEYYLACVSENLTGVGAIRYTADTGTQGAGAYSVQPPLLDSQTFSDTADRITHIYCTYSLGGTGYTRTVTEPLQIGEAHSRINTFARTVTDIVQFAEHASNITSIARTVTEFLAFGEQAQRTVAFSRMVTEKLAFAEAHSRAITFARTVTDYLALDEQAQRTAAFARVITDYVAFDESVATVKATAHSRTVTDYVKFAEHASNVLSGITLLNFPLKLTSTQEELYKIDRTLEELYKLISTQEQKYKIKKKEY